MAEVEIPVEIITEILTRLPVKALCRFKCVSKAWNSLISNPNPNIIVVSHHSLFSASIPDDRHNNNLHFTKLSLLPDGHVNLNPIDSCNGFLLISGDTMKTLFICNPANNTYRLLPSIQGRYHECLGFGYDSHTDDYKVISVFQNLHVSVLEICVYSMRENVWEFIKDKSSEVRKCFLFQPVVVGANGVLYFVSFTKKRKLVLMRLDVRTEVFSIVDYPGLDCYDFSKSWITFMKLGGCLCSAVNFRSESDHLMSVDVWEMREGGKKVSWVKLFRIQMSEVVGDARLVAYSKARGEVLLEVDRAWFGWYDLVTKRVEKVKTHGLGDENRLDVAMTYVESLVSKAVSITV